MSLVEYIIPSTLISLFVVDIYFYVMFKRHLCNDKFATTTLLNTGRMTVIASTSKLRKVF
jgi:hypothetical protein